MLDITVSSSRKESKTQRTTTVKLVVDDYVALVLSCNQWRLYIAVMPRPVNEKVIIFHSVPSSLFEFSDPSKVPSEQEEQEYTMCARAENHTV